METLHYIVPVPLFDQSRGRMVSVAGRVLFQSSNVIIVRVRNKQGMLADIAMHPDRLTAR